MSASIISGSGDSTLEECRLIDGRMDRQNICCNCWIFHQTRRPMRSTSKNERSCLDKCTAMRSFKVWIAAQPSKMWLRKVNVTHSPLANTVEMSLSKFFNASNCFGGAAHWADSGRLWSRWAAARYACVCVCVCNLVCEKWGVDEKERVCARQTFPGIN